MDKLDSLYPLLQAELGNNIPRLASWASLIALVVAVLLIRSFMGDNRTPKVPIAFVDEIPKAKDRIDRWTNDTRNLLIDGYKTFRDQAFGVNTTEGINIIIPLAYLDILKGQKSLSFAQFLEEDFTFKEYTKLGNLSTSEINILNKKFNPLLPQYTPVIEELIREQWSLGDHKSPTAVKLYPHVHRLVSRISARMFHSAESARNDHWVDIGSQYVHTAMMWTGNLRNWPKYLRPVVYRFVSGYSDITGQFLEGRKMVAETLKKKKANGNKPLSDPPSFLDLLTDVSVDPAAIDDVETQTIVQMNLVVAAIQAMSATVMQSIIDLAAYPEYVEELREEVSQALKEGNGTLSKQALAGMLKLDSFIKETQRFNSPDLTSYQRKNSEPLTLSNGLYLPKGSRLVLPTISIHMDSNFFPRPKEFDGFRFYRMRQESLDARNSHQMVAVGKKDLTWGYGRYACPGRYMAEIVMKLLMAEFIMRYDVSLIGERPKCWEFEGLIMPDRDCELLLTSRAVPE